MRKFYRGRIEPLGLVEMVDVLELQNYASGKTDINRWGRVS